MSETLSCPHCGAQLQDYVGLKEVPATPVEVTPVAQGVTAPEESKPVDSVVPAEAPAVETAPEVTSA